MGNLPSKFYKEYYGKRIGYGNIAFQLGPLIGISILMIILLIIKLFFGLLFYAILNVIFFMVSMILSLIPGAAIMFQLVLYIIANWLSSIATDIIGHTVFIAGILIITGVYIGYLINALRVMVNVSPHLSRNFVDMIINFILILFNPHVWTLIPEHGLNASIRFRRREDVDYYNKDLKKEYDKISNINYYSYSNWIKSNLSLNASKAIRSEFVKFVENKNWSGLTYKWKNNYIKTYDDFLGSEKNFSVFYSSLNNNKGSLDNEVNTFISYLNFVKYIPKKEEKRGKDFYESVLGKNQTEMGKLWSRFKDVNDIKVNK